MTCGRRPDGQQESRRRFGNVRKLPSGRFQARYPGPDGQLRTAPNTFDTKTDAECWLTVTESEMLRGDWLDPLAGAIPLGPYPAHQPTPDPTLLDTYRLTNPDQATWWRNRLARVRAELDGIGVPAS